MRDLRLVVPQVLEDSDPAGRTPPSGFLFPDMSRLGGDSTPQLFSGVQKLVQQLYLELLTDTLPNGVGSGLASRLRTADEDNITAIAQVGISDLFARMRRYQENLDLPLDERIASLVLTAMTFDARTNRFKMVLELATEAGNQYTLEPPLV